MHLLPKISLQKYAKDNVNKNGGKTKFQIGPLKFDTADFLENLVQRKIHITITEHNLESNPLNM